MDDKLWGESVAPTSMLVDRLSDEICDVEYYLDVVDELIAKCDPEAEEAARGFCEAAKDEYTHARFIKEWLQHECVMIPEATGQKLAKAEMRLWRTLR